MHLSCGQACRRLESVNELSDRIITSTSESSNSHVPCKEVLLPPPSFVAELFLSNNYLVGESTATSAVASLPETTTPDTRPPPHPLLPVEIKLLRTAYAVTRNSSPEARRYAAEAKLA